MQRGSDRLSVHRDEEMKHELQGLLRSGHPTRSEEWHDPEPTADDDPEVWRGPVAPLDPRMSLAAVRVELARYVGRGDFPASPADLGRIAGRKNAPDPVIEALEGLPRKARYTNLEELAEAVVQAGRSGSGESGEAGESA
ncbi:DUF2795 domain-containing protein [Streptomyces sp. NPDC046197]|uniref:DUF2795 domain-containing protein n=1 Tax=Streptomyces sp. NPDC046197 TaxID=3154337 RepID=UPI0033E324B0